MEKSAQRVEGPHHFVETTTMMKVGKGAMTERTALPIALTIIAWILVP